MKKIILISLLYVITNTYAVAQEDLGNSKDSAQYSLSVTAEQKKQVEAFKSKETELIQVQKQKIKSKRVALQQKEDILMNEVIESRGNESLTPEQKESFKVRHSNIKKEAEELSKENSDFMKQIFERRKDFYHKLKQQ